MPALAPSSAVNFFKTSLGNPFSSSLNIGQRANLLSTASAADFGITGVTKGIGSALFSLDGLINIAGIALFFCNPATSLIGAGLFLFSAGASLFKAAKHAFSALGSLAKFDLVGFATNGLTAAFYAASALPLGKVAGSLNMLKTNAMSVTPLEGDLAKFSIDLVKEPGKALGIMNRNIGRLKAGLKAETEIVSTYGKQLRQVEEQIGNQVGNNVGDSLLKVGRKSPIFEDAIAATKGELQEAAKLSKEAVKAAQKVSDQAARVAKEATEAAAKDATKKELAERLAKEAQSKATTLKDKIACLQKNELKQANFEKLLAQRKQALDNIGYAETRQAEWQKLLDDASLARVALDARVALAEGDIKYAAQLHKQSLKRVTVDRRKFFDEVLELFYGKPLREKAGEAISTTAEAGRALRASVREESGVLPALRRVFKGKPPIPSTVPTPAGGSMSTAGYVERNGLLVRAAG